MATTLSTLSFQAWLETLSLDAAHTDLCPNLAFIPIAQLRRLWREGCAPAAEAIVDWKFKPLRARVESRRPAAALAPEHRSASI